MLFHHTAEQLAFRDAVERFAKNELAQGALERAHDRQYPREVARKLSQQGLLGIALDPKDGGQGGTLMDSVIAIEAIAKYCPRSADVIQAGNFGPLRTLAEFATPDLKSKYLPRLLHAEAIISLCMSEPEAGSATTDLKTSATKVDGGFLLNGSKVFSTHSPYADIFLVYVRFGAGVKGIGSVIVDRGSPGLTMGKPSRFMSGEEWSELHFQDCFVPQENLLLGAGGFKRQISGFNVERIGNAARSLALGRYAFDQAKAYAMTRTQFSRRLSEFQGIQWKFSDMAVKLDAAQLLLYQAADTAAGQLPSAYDTAVAKLYCNLTGHEVSNESMQVMGAAGYSQLSLVEYCVRRTRGWMIAGGSIEMLKNRIAEEVFGMKFDQRPPQPAT